MGKYGCYHNAPQARVGEIFDAIKRYAGVAKRAGVGPQFASSGVDVSASCARDCGLDICKLRQTCVGRDQAVLTRNEVLGLGGVTEVIRPSVISIKPFSMTYTHWGGKVLTLSIKNLLWK